MEKMPRWKMAEKLIDEIWDELCKLSKVFSILRGRVGYKGKGGESSYCGGLMILQEIEDYPFDYKTLKRERDYLRENIGIGERLQELFNYLNFSFKVSTGAFTPNVFVEVSLPKLSFSLTFGYEIGEKLKEEGVKNFEDLINFWRKKLRRYEEHLAFLEEEISSYEELLSRKERRRKKLNEGVYSRVTA